MRFDIT